MSATFYAKERRTIEGCRQKLILEAAVGDMYNDGLSFRVRMQKWLSLNTFEEALNREDARLNALAHESVK